MTPRTTLLAVALLLNSCTSLYETKVCLTSPISGELYARRMDSAGTLRGPKHLGSVEAGRRCELLLPLRPGSGAPSSIYFVIIAEQAVFAVTATANEHVEIPAAWAAFPSELWAHAVQGKVGRGMTQAQVRMAWGDPTEKSQNVSALVASETWTWMLDRSTGYGRTWTPKHSYRSCTFDSFGLVTRFSGSDDA